MSYEVTVHRLEVACRIGVHPQERRDPRSILFDITMTVDGKAVATDDVKDTIDYGDVCALVDGLASSGERHTLERLGQEVVDAILTNFPLVRALTVRVEKPNPPMGPLVASASVHLSKSR